MARGGSEEKGGFGGGQHPRRGEGEVWGASNDKGCIRAGGEQTVHIITLLRDGERGEQSKE